MCLTTAILARAPYRAVRGARVRPHITTQQQFEDEHVSYYMERTHGNTTVGERKTTMEERKAIREERTATKRAKLLDAFIDAIPMQQLQRAFGSGCDALTNLVVAYGFNTVRTTIFKELKELFDEL